MPQTISFLLGAGFSFNKGYPLVSELSEKVLSFNPNSYGFDTTGILGDKTFREQAKYPSYYYHCLDYLKEIILYFNTEYCNAMTPFYYEEFYDFLVHEAVKHNFLRLLWLIHKDKDEEIKQSHDQAINKCIDIINQLIEMMLIDSNGNNDYYDVPFKPDGYNGFLSLIQHYLKKDYTINIHTLNHDLLTEWLCKSPQINVELSDGFTNETPFYGKIQRGNGEYEIEKLPLLSDEYNSNLRLYKLHGSVDYFTFNFMEDGVQYAKHIKKRWAIHPINVFRKREDGDDEQCINLYNSNFLSGTTEKTRHYKEEPFDTFFHHFEKNLKETDILIFIGYGGRDSGINKMIAENLKKDALIYLVNPRGIEKGHKEFMESTGLFIKSIKKNTDSVLIDDLL